MRQQIYTLPAALREDGKEDEDEEEEEKEAPVGSIRRRRRRKGSSGEQSKNLNMVSASAHVLGGDSCFRTVFMLLAAMVSSVTGISGAICDAYGAIAVSMVIVMIIITVMSDVVDRAMYFYEHFALRAGTYRSLQSQGDDEEEEEEEENELLGV